MSPLAASTLHGATAAGGGPLVLCRAARGATGASGHGAAGGQPRWLGPWEATAPERGAAAGCGSPASCGTTTARRRPGGMLPFAIRLEGRLVGQMHLFGIAWGSLLLGAGRLLGRPRPWPGAASRRPPWRSPATTPWATLGLHRVEVNIRPENAASLAVVRKLGFRDEGVRRGYLHIDGAWRDHRTFALTTEDLGGRTLLERLHTRPHQSHWRHTAPRPRWARARAPNVVSVQPSSLIFLVIIAIWAAYFVQHWVRRREHLATARSVDQFSESMRVLERRCRCPQANLSTPSAPFVCREPRPRRRAPRCSSSAPPPPRRPQKPRPPWRLRQHPRRPLPPVAGRGA